MELKKQKLRQFHSLAIVRLRFDLWAHLPNIKLANYFTELTFQHAALAQKYTLRTSIKIGIEYSKRWSQGNVHDRHTECFCIERESESDIRKRYNYKHQYGRNTQTHTLSDPQFEFTCTEKKHTLCFPHNLQNTQTHTRSEL